MNLIVAIVAFTIVAAGPPRLAQWSAHPDF
jgi:hypothetical protein